jgi:AcrR family transcriptional regulator
MKETTPKAGQLPPSIQLAWGRRADPSRGPKRALSLDQVVAAGVAAAQADGLAALSMSRIATELGVATMTLYRYVASKDELLELMVDAALGRPPRPHADEDWRAGLTRWAKGVRAAYTKNPWALRVPITGPPLGPNNVRWLEVALRTLTNAPLAEADKISIVLLLSGFVRNEVTLTTDVAAAVASTLAGGAMPLSYGTALRALTDATHFPAVHTVIASGAFDDDDGGDLSQQFDFGLSCILDGVAALMGRAAVPNGDGTAPR